MNSLPTLDDIRKQNAASSFDLQREEISNRANAREEAIAKTTAEFKDLIERVGLYNFAQIFVDAHAHQTHVVDVHEFLFHRSDSEEEQAKVRKISDAYARERLAFDLTFYHRYMPKMSVDRVAATLANMAELDISRKVLDGIRAGVQSVDEHQRMSRQMQERQGDDDNGPKRAISAYLYFATDRRPQLKKEHPEMGFGELTMTIATEWKEMSEKNKRPFNDLAKADKERYARECGDMMAAAAAFNE